MRKSPRAGLAALSAEPLDPTALAHDLDRRIAGVSQLLRAGVRSRRSLTALLTLRRLDLEGPQRVGDLAAAERVAQPTMTVMVRRLEAEGLVERTTDPEDARAVKVALTDAGRSELAAVRAARAALLRRRIEALPPDAQAVLAAALPVLEDLIAADPEHP